MEFLANFGFICSNRTILEECEEDSSSSDYETEREMIKRDYLHDFYDNTPKFYQINQLIRLKNATSTNHTGFFQSLTKKQVQSFWLVNDFTSLKTVHIQIRISHFFEPEDTPFQTGYSKYQHNLKQICQFPVKRLIIEILDNGLMYDRIVLNHIASCVKKIGAINNIEIRFPSAFNPKKAMYNDIFKKISRALSRLRILKGVNMEYSTSNLNMINSTSQKLLAMKCLEAKEVGLGKTDGYTQGSIENHLQKMFMSFLPPPKTTKHFLREKFFQGITKLSLSSIIVNKNMILLLKKGLQSLESLTKLEVSIDARYHTEYLLGDSLILPPSLNNYKLIVFHANDEVHLNKTLSFWLGRSHSSLQSLEMQIEQTSYLLITQEELNLDPNSAVLLVQKLVYPNLRSLQIEINCRFGYRIDSLQHFQQLRVLKLSINQYAIFNSSEYYSKCFLPYSIQSVWMRFNTDLAQKLNNNFFEKVMITIKSNEDCYSDLKAIYLEKNYIEDKNWKYFNLTTLEELHLSKCKINLSALKQLLYSDRLCGLVKLNISGSSFGSEPDTTKTLFTMIAECPIAKNLEELNLTETNLVDSFTINNQSPNFVGLHNLRYLSLSRNMKLHRSGLNELFKLEFKKLIELNINQIGCTIRDIRDACMKNAEILSSLKILRTSAKIHQEYWNDSKAFFNHYFKKLDPDEIDRSEISFRKKFKEAYRNSNF